MDVEEAIEECRWTLTGYIQQHEYIRLENYPDAFAIIAEVIEEDAVVGEFRGRRYRYCVHHNFKYWRIGVIINRVRVQPAVAE